MSLLAGSRNVPLSAKFLSPFALLTVGLFSLPFNIHLFAACQPLSKTSYAAALPTQLQVAAQEYQAVF